MWRHFLIKFFSLFSIVCSVSATRIHTLPRYFLFVHFNLLTYLFYHAKLFGFHMFLFRINFIVPKADFFFWIIAFLLEIFFGAYIMYTKRSAIQKRQYFKLIMVPLSLCTKQPALSPPPPFFNLAWLRDVDQTYHHHFCMVKQLLFLLLVFA